MKTAALLALCGAMWAVFAVPVHAAGARKDTRVTVVVGDYRVEFRDPGAWTLGNIHYGTAQVGLSNGWSGLVLRRPKGGWIGTGHTEGGLEKVETVRLLIDGQEVALEADATYKGRAARLEKVSRVDNLKLHAVYEITRAGISETHTIQAIDDQPIVTLYAFMHPWTPATKQWMAEAAGGKIISGDLVSHDQKVKGNHWPLMNDVRWSAVYDPSAKVAIVLCYPELYKGAGLRTGIWDLKHYHKQYYQPYANETIAKGTRRTFRCRVWCVKAEPDAWREAVEADVKQRKANTPK